MSTSSDRIDSASAVQQTAQHCAPQFVQHRPVTERPQGLHTGAFVADLDFDEDTVPRAEWDPRELVS